MPILDRRVPTDWTHVERWPLSALAAEDLPTKVPVALGVNWYQNFDVPVYRNGRWFIGEGSLGRVRGGHCVCLKPYGVVDNYSWWKFYNQGDEGACVGFGCTRMMTLLNRKRYNPWWLWDMAKPVDQWPDTNPGDSNGTSVSAACDILRNLGHVPWVTGYPWPGLFSDRDKLAASLPEGISTNRWATRADQVVAALGYPPDQTHVLVLNSWGTSYPHGVWLPVETLDRLISEEGEAALVTDR